MSDTTVSPISPELLDILRCPLAVQSDEYGEDPGRLELVHNCWLVCADTGMKYPIRDGIPVMLIDEGKKWQNTDIADLPVPPLQPDFDILYSAQYWSNRVMKTILQIEDNYANRILAERVLEKEYRLLHASDGETGVSMAIDEKPDLILVDMGLPDIDGQTVVTLMRQIPDLQNTPIVAITAWPRDKAEEMAKRYGCDGCIVKPIDVRNFPSQIADFLNPKQQDET